MKTIILPFAGYVKSNIKKLWNITKFAKKRNLSISNLDEVGDHLIALDTKKRKLLYAKTAPNTSSCLLLDLNNLEACSIKKEYSSIKAGELKANKLPYFLKSIFLNLAFKNDSGNILLPLFDAQKKQHGNIELLEAQSKKWQTNVSKLLPIQVKDRA